MQAPKRRARAVLAVREDHARPGGSQRSEPVEQIRLPRVSAETAEQMGLRLHADLLAGDFHFLRAVGERAAHRPARLIPDHQDSVVGSGRWFCR